MSKFAMKASIKYICEVAEIIEGVINFIAKFFLENIKIVFFMDKHKVILEVT